MLLVVNVIAHGRGVHAYDPFDKGRVIQYGSESGLAKEGKPHRALKGHAQFPKRMPAKRLLA